MPLGVFEGVPVLVPVNVPLIVPVPVPVPVLVSVPVLRGLPDSLLVPVDEGVSLVL